MAEFLKYTGERTTKAAAEREARMLAAQDGVICWAVQDLRPVVYVDASDVDPAGLPDGWTVVDHDPEHLARLARAQRGAKTRSENAERERAHRQHIAAIVASIEAAA